MEEKLLDRLQQLENRFEVVEHQLSRPDVAANQKEFRGLMKELADLKPIVELLRSYRRVSFELQETQDMVFQETDSDVRQMAKDELQHLEREKSKLEEDLRLALIPKDPNDNKNIIMEIRPGAGGDEASLFTEALFRAYCHFANRQGWRVELLSAVGGNVGGLREVIALISGEKVYSRLKFERGVHRVQRVPTTETQGRVHTSTVTVAVLPEAEEVDVAINSNDLRIDVFRSGGSGGQSVNTTDSAVRVTHLPSGIVVICQDEKSQIKNKAKAMKVLLARLKAKEEERAIQSASEARLAQIGTGDRSERIRTYNFPQSRVTDHRIGLTLHRLDEIMTGDFDEILDALTAMDQAERLKENA